MQILKSQVSLGACKRLQHHSEKNNIAENAKRKPYTYSLGQRVMILQDSSRKFGTNAYKGPYEITTINPNGTVRLRIGAVQQTTKIRIFNLRCYPQPLSSCSGATSLLLRSNGRECIRDETAPLERS